MAWGVGRVECEGGRWSAVVSSRKGPSRTPWKGVNRGEGTGVNVNGGVDEAPLCRNVEEERKKGRVSWGFERLL